MKISIILPLLLISAGLMFGQGSWTVKNSKFTIDGTSNLHDWTSNVNTVEGSGEMVVENGVLTKVNSMSIKIPVKSIKSPKGSIMDGKTYDALKEKQHPNITFQMVSVKGITGSGSNYKINATGNLTIAGVTKLIDLPVDAKVLSNGSVELSGEKKLNMSTFNIKPPTAMLGAVSCGDGVTLKFKVTATGSNATR